MRCGEGVDGDGGIGGRGRRALQSNKAMPRIAHVLSLETKWRFLIGKVSVVIVNENKLCYQKPLT